MTNYEWIVKNKAELVKDILSYGLSKEKGTFGHCSKTMCVDCDFGCNPFCSTSTKKWLEEEHEPLYKKGDIVINLDDQIQIVKDNDCGEDYVTISRYASGAPGITVPIIEIKKKLGHIDEGEVENCG